MAMVMFHVFADRIHPYSSAFLLIVSAVGISIGAALIVM